LITSKTPRHFEIGYQDFASYKGARPKVDCSNRLEARFLLETLTPGLIIIYETCQKSTGFEARDDSQKLIRLMAQPQRAEKSSVFSEWRFWANSFLPDASSNERF
jgi:hypothetical protein